LEWVLFSVPPSAANWFPELATNMSELVEP